MALDVGMSTGGFADCLLQHGAAAVVGIEVGHGQLDAVAGRRRARDLLREHPCARRIEPARWLAAHGIGTGFDLIVVDLSFISTVSGLLAQLAASPAPGRGAGALIKPQFELGPERAIRSGIVRAMRTSERPAQRAFAAAPQPAGSPGPGIASRLSRHRRKPGVFPPARRGRSRSPQESRYREIVADPGFNSGC